VIFPETASKNRNHGCTRIYYFALFRTTYVKGLSLKSNFFEAFTVFVVQVFVAAPAANPRTIIPRASSARERPRDSILGLAERFADTLAALWKSAEAA
jgi:hypothetical protein